MEYAVSLQSLSPPSAHIDDGDGPISSWLSISFCGDVRPADPQHPAEEIRPAGSVPLSARP